VIDRRQNPRERRESERAPFVAAVSSASSEDAIELALALDLSRTGMRLRRCADAVPIPSATDPTTSSGPMVRIEFELPDGGEPVVARAQLLFAHGDGSFRASGLRFVELALEDELRIARYVNCAARS